MFRSVSSIELEGVSGSITVFLSQLVDFRRKLSGSIPGDGDSRINKEFGTIGIYVNLVCIQ
jgi:hypothetical protein